MKPWAPEEIESFRKKYRLTRRALGEIIGATVSTIYNYERGLRTPNKMIKTLLSRVEEDFERRGGEN